ncbi:hypothetical protein LTR99_007458 [Exophiala xenobiotica]|uniref:Major facilitator superfamily (MFS) profile domain-containing protein n=1 Tax=Vermiconidia calcicola TaxID=1690605 RepID=A0AAV9Q2Q1_9PEZI|nr:hypothetical protein H2202_006854 [Exophiala xenobiotica]KAK5534567.1 hypothetical protein LTR25_006599 [Vermiconidia calcicola]KAK5544552.1 hypothetical protein LTR23_004316 [Chaetothyriales sp. CCFEE 6169]KAK5207501.1 hypothetical protein LTR41_007070 [Exophiala xenobiotica]KAK5228155.1 hypothetical protein LTR72_002038 [Exophiala xenobiotica]
MSQPKSPETIARAVQELEHLLAEAVQIAETAGISEAQRKPEKAKQDRPMSPSRRPSEGLAKRVNTYLERASPEPVASPPSEDNTRAERDLAPDEDVDVPISDNLRLIPPQPIAEPPNERKTKLSRDRRTSGQTSSSRNGRSARFLDIPEIRSRSNSTRVPNGQRQSLRPAPIIQLNNVDLNNEDAEEKDSLLGSRGDLEVPRPGHERHFSNISKIDLNGARHVDIDEKPDDVNVHKTCHHAPVARNWPDSRKRFAALVSCINTACLGLIIGIYAGEVPAIQYVVVDLNRRVIFGNVFLYCGLVIPTLVCWPLPLLHGRKPYTIAALVLALCLQIPQGIMVISFRSPDVERYRVILLLARGLSGFVFGFANINNLGTLLDVFGASLQSSKSHEGLANPYDVRRHGGGMGVWLAIWSWCTTGSIALGFVIGAFIISGAAVDWGFWVSLTLLMGVLLLNVIAPEVRRSAFRRTIAEIIGEGGSFSRVARGEVKLHLTGNGPYWWGEEVKAGLQLTWKMIKQPGFLILSIYAAWAYAQFTLILMLLGALTSTLYRYRPVDVGLCVLSLVIGSALAIPFQKASWFSRARYYPPRTNSMTLQKALPWTSHTIRRALVMVFLPLAAIAYALTSRGPSFPVAVPCVFAGCVAWASALAIGECYALMMQTFDVSDLQPGMTGRPVRKSVVMRYREQRTNFSSYPRVSAGIAVTQSLKFVFGAVSVGICGRVERRYGAMQAALIVSGVLLTLILLLTAVLVRWKSVQMIPSRRGHSDEEESAWEPVVLGHSNGLTRKISLLEAGDQSRWSEIRRRNRLTGG